MPVSITVNLELKTCEFGHVYAVPNWVNSGHYICPMCAKEVIRGVNQHVDNELDNERKLQRTISALRGALTKAKKARK